MFSLNLCMILHDNDVFYNILLGPKWSCMVKPKPTRSPNDHVFQVLPLRDWNKIKANCDPDSEEDN